MLMLPLFLLIVRALHRLAVWALARSLHDTGVFVVAQVQTIENRIGEALCPMRRWRRFRSWFR